MIRRPLLALLTAFGLFLAATPLLAHHSWPVNFGKEVTVTGTVTDYNWSNPHVMIGLDVKDQNGKVEHWNVGGPSISRMEAKGWHKDSLKLGDTITGSGYQFSDGQRILRLQKITMADGSVKLLYAN